jgi:UPF0042 nucleotide-binding protein
MNVVVITGMSGGGKTEALRALEDLGYFCVDNLPTPLLTGFVDLLHRSGGAPQVALSIDVRASGFLAGHEQTFEQIRAAGHHLEVVFLDAQDEVLVRRFSETRRRHPLHRGDLRTGLAEERAQLAGLRAEAARVVDTSRLSVQELRRLIRQQFATSPSELHVSLLSFGFKHGIPSEADLSFDVRFLTNPFFVEELRPLSGIDSRVSEFVLRQPESRTFLDQVNDLLGFLLPLYHREGKSYLTVAFGCTGGRHRSVALVEALRDRLTHRPLSVRHRDLERS